MLSENLLDAMERNIKESGEFAKAYIKTLQAKGVEIVHALSRKEINVRDLTDEQAQDLALRLFKKAGCG